jgi:hypothetical protein
MLSFELRIDISALIWYGFSSILRVNYWPAFVGG